MYIMKSTECIIFSMNNATNINKTSNHLSPQVIEYNLSPQAIECKQTTTYDVENPDPGFGGVQNMAGVNRLMRSYPSPLIMALPTTIQI